MPASSAELSALDAAYRRQQAVIQGAAGLAVLRLWRSITPQDVLTRSGAISSWLAQAVAITTQANRRSAQQAATFYDDVRVLQTGEALRPELVDPPPAEQVRTSLFVTGPFAARQRLERVPQTTLVNRYGEPTGVEGLRSLLDRQVDTLRAGQQKAIDDAMTLSGQTAAAAVVRHVGNGARDQIKTTVQRDARAKGYVRVTDGEPCYFCAALASRGADYKEDSFKESDARFEGPGTAKVHDSCGCHLRPVYSRSPDEIPELNRALQQRWNDENESSTMLEWRQRYENRYRAA
jgi:hypothetical protein